MKTWHQVLSLWLRFIKQEAICVTTWESGLEFERYIAGLLDHHGYVVRSTKLSGDYGVDFVAVKGGEVVAVQCKRLTGVVGLAAVQQVVAGAAMYGCTSTMVISNGSFSAAAVALAERHKCRLIDGVELTGLAVGYIHQRGTDLEQLDTLFSRRPREWHRFTRDGRLALILAREEARDLHSEGVQPVHLVLGVVQSAGNHLATMLSDFGLEAEVIRGRISTALLDDPTFEDDAEALRAIGIDLHAVRDKIARTFGEDAWNNALRKSGWRRRRYGHLPFTKASKKALELALREALAHKDSTIGCEHVVLGILRSGDRSAVGLITEHVDADRLREEIVGLLDEAA